MQTKNQSRVVNNSSLLVNVYLLFHFHATATVCIGNNETEIWGRVGRGKYQVGMHTQVFCCLPDGFLRVGPSAERKTGLNGTNFVSCSRSLYTHCYSKSTKQTWQKLVGTWTSNTEMKGCIVYSWSHKLLTPTWFVPLDSHCKSFSFLLVFSLHFIQLFVQDSILDMKYFKLKGLFDWKFK